MVAVEVRDEDDADVMRPHTVFQHLPLRAFAAVDEVVRRTYREHLGRGVAAGGRSGRGRTQNLQLECQGD